jgi:hypothetical protein
MGKSKNEIGIENFNEWLATTGYLFPSNPVELERFETLFKDFNYQLSSEVVDPIKIINGTYSQVIKKIESFEKISDIHELKIAARNLKEIPDHILKKIKSNQNGLNSRET